MNLHRIVLLQKISSHKRMNLDCYHRRRVLPFYQLCINARSPHSSVRSPEKVVSVTHLVHKNWHTPKKYIQVSDKVNEELPFMSTVKQFNTLRQRRYRPTVIENNYNRPVTRTCQRPHNSTNQIIEHKNITRHQCTAGWYVFEKQQLYYQQQKKKDINKKRHKKCK